MKEEYLLIRAKHLVKILEKAEILNYRVYKDETLSPNISIFELVELKTKHDLVLDTKPKKD